MKIKNIEKYKISESDVFSDDDKKHVENYKQLIKFFESALNNSLDEKTANYNSLHNSCLQCIRFLDSLIFTYESSLKSAKTLNSTLDKIISDVSKESEGNEEEHVSPS